MAIQSVATQQKDSSAQSGVQHKDTIRWARRTFNAVVIYSTLTCLIAFAAIYTANQARKQVQIMADQEQRQLQAYVGIDGLFSLKCAACDSRISRPDDYILAHLFDNIIKFKIKNYGQTPAYRIDAKANFWSVPFGEALPKGFNYPFADGEIKLKGISQTIRKPGPTLNPQATETAVIGLMPANITELVNAIDKHTTLFFYGYISYRTSFGRNCTAPFCTQYLPDNPEGSQFADCEEHNTPECDPP